MIFKGRRMALGYGFKPVYLLPFLNIIFLLLIFFIFSSTFIVPSGIMVNLPAVVTGESVSVKSIEISLTRENQIYFNERLINVNELNTLLKQLAKRRQAIMLKADKGIFLGQIIAIWDMARKAGIAQISVATSPD